MKKKLLIFSGMLLLLFACNQEDQLLEVEPASTKNDAEEFTFVPDDNFEQALIDLGIDTDGLNDFVLTQNISAVGILNLNDRGIQDLTGIEGFSKLRRLHLTRNLLTTLDLSQNTLLKALYASRNQITSLDLSNNTNLIRLNVAINNLQSLNIQNGNNLNMTFLHTYSNPDLQCIQVDEVAYLANSEFTQIDVESTLSTKADCFNYTYVPDDNFEQALINLGLDDVLDDNVLNTTIQGVPFLNVESQEISDLTGIRGFKNLKRLNATRNNLTMLDVSDNSNLKALYVSQNQIASLDLSQNANLIRLNVSSNALEELVIKNGNNLNMTFLHAFNNPLLMCIEVDEVEFLSSASFAVIDQTSSFAVDCGYDEMQ